MAGKWRKLDDLDDLDNATGFEPDNDGGIDPEKSGGTGIDPVKEGATGFDPNDGNGFDPNDDSNGFKEDNGTGFKNEEKGYSSNESSQGFQEPKGRRVDVEETIERQGSNGETIKTKRSWQEVETGPKEYNYGKGDMTADEYATQLFGKNKTDKDVEEIAKIFNENNFDEAADIGKYKINTASAEKAKAVGQYVGQRGGRYNTKYVNKLGGNITGQFKEGVTFGKELAQRDKKVKSFLSDIDKNYRDEIRAKVENDEVQKIMKKLNNGENLSPEEVNKFKEAKATFQKVHDQFVQTKDDLNFDKNENIYSDFSKTGNKVTDRKANSSRFRSRVDGNATYQALYRNQNMLDYDIDANGKITGKKGDYNASFKTEEVSKTTSDYLDEAKKYRAYTDAKDDFTGDAYKYLEDTDDVFKGNTDAEKLYKLSQKGIVDRVDSNGVLTAEGELLDSYAYSNKAGILGTDSNVTTNLNNASAQAVSKFNNIKTGNIDYVNSGKGFSLDYDKGTNKFNISQDSLNYLTDEDKKKYEKLINSKDIGNEDLGDFADLVNLRKDQSEVVSDVFKGQANAGTYSDIEKQARANYESLQKVAQEDVPLPIDRERLFTSGGVSDKDLAKSIAGKKSFDELTPKEVGALYGASNKVDAIGLSMEGITHHDISQIKKNNAKLFEGIADLDAMDDKQVAKIFGERVGLKGNGIGEAFGVHIRGVDMKDSKSIEKFVSSLGNGDDIKVDALKDMFEISGNKYNVGGNVGFEDILNAAKTGKLDELGRTDRARAVLSAVGDKLDEISKNGGEVYDEENLKKIGNLAKKFKDGNFSNEELEKVAGFVDDAKQYKESIKAKDAANAVDKAKGFLKNGKLKGGLAIAGMIAAPMIIGKMASDASEERERKRQEMNQLIAAQNSSIRGGY